MADRIAELRCVRCGKQSNENDGEGHAVTFKDTAFLILGSALFGDEKAESRWPIICDGCWDKFRERFQK